MFQHLFASYLRRTRWVAAAFAMTLLTSCAVPAKAETGPRAVVFRPPVLDLQAQSWGPLTFGMEASEAARAALQAGGHLVSAAAVGQPLTYHGSSRARGGRRSIRDHALVWFDGGRLSRVTVVLHRQTLARAGACLATHRHTVAHVLANGGALDAAATGDNMQRGPDAQQRAADGGDTVWAAEAQQSGLRVVVMTNWEEPASARQAGADETCIATVTYLAR